MSASFRKGVVLAVTCGPIASSCDKGTATDQASRSSPTATIDFDASSGHLCVIDPSGYPACWGRNDQGQAIAPTMELAKVCTGDGFSCGLTTDERPICWGGGPGSLVPPQGEYADLSCGTSHVCAITEEGVVECWGSNENGECDPPPSEQVSFSSVVAGDHVTCGLSKERRALCWGTNVGAAPGVDLSTLAVHGVACGVSSDGDALCWGPNQPAKVMGEGPPYKDVCVQRAHLCALKPDGEVGCVSLRGGKAMAPPPNTRFQTLECGGNFACGITEAGGLSCWGEPPYPSSPIEVSVTSGCDEAPVTMRVWEPYGVSLDPERDNSFQPGRRFGFVNSKSDLTNGLGLSRYGIVLATPRDGPPSYEWWGVSPDWSSDWRSAEELINEMKWCSEPWILNTIGLNAAGDMMTVGWSSRQFRSESGLRVGMTFGDLKTLYSSVEVPQLSEEEMRMNAAYGVQPRIFWVDLNTETGCKVEFYAKPDSEPIASRFSCEFPLE